LTVGFEFYLIPYQRTALFMFTIISPEEKKKEETSN